MDLLLLSSGKSRRVRVIDARVGRQTPRRERGRRPLPLHPRGERGPAQDLAVRAHIAVPEPTYLCGPDGEALQLVRSDEGDVVGAWHRVGLDAELVRPEGV